MTVTVKDIIKAELLKVCLEVTGKFRTKHEKKEKKEKYTTEEVQKVREAYKSIGWTSDQVDKQMEAMSILHDAPELKKPTIPAMEPFCVVVCEKNVTSHPFGISPTMWAKKRDTVSAHVFHTDGTLDCYMFNYTQDAVRFATDDEVVSWVDNLTDKQWTTIRLATLFSPIIEAALTKEVTVPSNGDPGGDDEVSLPDGRTITVVNHGK